MRNRRLPDAAQPGESGIALVRAERQHPAAGLRFKQRGHRARLLVDRLRHLSGSRDGTSRSTPRSTRSKGCAVGSGRGVFVHPGTGRDQV